MTETEGRTALVEAHKAWVGTPYTHSGCIRGAGANCATLMWGIAHDAGVIPDVPMPRWYSPQFHAHNPEERLLKYVLGCGAVEITEEQLQPGDVIAYLTGQSHGHLAMVIEYPRKILQTHQATGAQYGHAFEGRLRACKRRYFSLWAPSETSTSTTPEKGDSATHA